jgi:hypothetical protein
MAINYDMFNLKTAIAMYLGKKSHQIEWGKEIVVSLDNQIILAWNITTKTEPTIESLIELWDIDHVNFYKNWQREKIKEKYEYIMTTGTEGCLTSLLDGNGDRIRMDARRGSVYNDLQNYETGVIFMTENSLPLMEYKDFYNVKHAFTIAQAQTIVREVRYYGLALLQHKWDKDVAIEACTTAAEVVAIVW